jgi:hypothetical protein
MGCGTIWKAPCDVGGMSYFYFKANPDTKWKKIPTTSIITNHPETMILFPDHVRGLYQFEFDMEFVEGSFLHFRGGSRWDKKDKYYYESKQEFIRKTIYG